MAKAFVSSTSVDLAEHRSAVRRVLEMMSIPNLAMEIYVSDERAPIAKCLDDVRKCSVYIGIFAHRYGYIPSGETKSLTELEYREAGLVGIDRLIFLLKDGALWNPQHMDSHTREGENGDRIRELRQELEESNTVAFFDTPEDLATKVAAAIHTWNGRRLERQGQISERRSPEFSRPLTEYLEFCQADMESFQAHYVQLAALVTKEQASIPRFAEAGLWPSAFRVLANSRAAGSNEQQPPNRTAESLLLSTPKGGRTVLAAEAGAGKTISLRRLRLLLSTERLKSGKGQIPLYINLPEWPASIDDFRSLIVHERTAVGCPIVPDEGLFLLLDGLDELGPDRRVGCISKISRWLDAHPEASMVVAVRKASNREAYPFGASVVEIQPLGREQIEEFVRKRVVEGRTAELLGRLFAPVPSSGSSSLSYLARSPFNLALLCVVFDLRGELPTSLGQLLRRLVDALYQREVDAGNAVPMMKDIFLRDLGGLSFGLSGHHVRTIMHVDWARKRLAEQNTFEFLKNVGVAGALLRLTKNERVISFSHSIFQRYFLAEHLFQNKDHCRKLLSVVSKSEVVQFPDHIVETLQLLMEFGDQESTIRLISNHNPCLAFAVLDLLGSVASLSHQSVHELMDELLVFFSERRLDQPAIQSNIERISRIDPASVLVLLSSGNPAVRRAVLGISAKTPTAVSVEVIFSCLADPNRSVRREARDALDALLQEDRPRLVASIEQWLLKMPREERHREAINVLNVLGFDDLLSVKLVSIGEISTAEYRALTSQVSLPAISAAFSIADVLLDARAVVLERQRQQATRREFQLAKAGATDQSELLESRLGSIDRFPELLEDLGSVDSVEARVVIRELKSLGEAICPQLIAACLKSENAKLRRRAPRVLAGIHYVRAIPDIIELLQDPDVRVVRDAIIALAQLGDQSVAWVFEEFVNHRDPAVAANALRGLEAVGGDGAVKIAWRFASDPRPDVRQMVLSLLATRDPVGLQGKISSFLYDEHNETRRQALAWSVRMFPVEGFRRVWIALRDNTGVVTPILYLIADILVRANATPTSAADFQKQKYDPDTAKDLIEFANANFEHICGCFCAALASEQSPAIADHIAMVYFRFLQWVNRFDEHLATLRENSGGGDTCQIHERP